MSQRLECGNGDSCSAGDTHLFPDGGQRVMFLHDMELPMVGGEESHAVKAGEWGVVFGLIEEAHHAGVIVDGTGAEVWADVDEDILF